jgi:hypothetical protein
VSIVTAIWRRRHRNRPNIADASINMNELRTDRSDYRKWIDAV